MGLYFIEGMSTFLAKPLILLPVLLGINFLLQAKVFRGPLDWDTSGHLYFAFLKHKGVSFKSSYSPGVKFMLPRLYTYMMPFIKDRYYRYRALNMFSSSLVILLLVTGTGTITPTKVPLFILLVLMMDSLWINYATSAVEFHSVPLVLLALLLTSIVPFPQVLFFQTLLICLLAVGFKMTDCTYFLPVAIAAWGEGGKALLPYISLCSVIVTGVTCLVFLRHKASATTYTKTRFFSHPKNKFVFINPLFIGLVGFAVWNGVKCGDIYGQSLLLAALAVFLAQKMFMAYFFYPVLVFSWFILLSQNCMTEVSCAIIWWGVFLVFFFHTLPHILLINAREIDIRMRWWVQLGFGHGKYLDQRDEQVAWLRDRIKPHERVYLWGGHVALLLMAGLTHVPDTFYSHNHLFLWSGIKDKINYALGVIRNQKPDYIIVAHPLGENRFPANVLSESYHHVYSLYDMAVYQQLNR